MIPIAVTLPNWKALASAFDTYGLALPTRKIDAERLVLDDPGAYVGSLGNGKVIDGLRNDIDLLHHGFMTVLADLSDRDAVIMSGYLSLYLKEEGRDTSVYVVSGTIYGWVMILRSKTSEAVKLKIKVILGKSLFRESINGI